MLNTSMLIQMMYENGQETCVSSEQLYGVLFLQVILDCLNFRRTMVPMEHLNQPPVVYGKCIFHNQLWFFFFFFLKYHYYHLMHNYWGWWSKFGDCGVAYILLSMDSESCKSLWVFSPWWKRIILSPRLFCICHSVHTIIASTLYWIQVYVQIENVSFPINILIYKHMSAQVWNIFFCAG